MPRPPRIDYPGARHHVMNRSARRDVFLVDDATCAIFVGVIGGITERFGARVHGYALMPNHFHLMLEVPDGNLSAVMRYVGSAFTREYNRHVGVDGPLFRGRFHNRLVTDDAYWMHLLAYLHLNPVKAKLARRPEDCIWSSHLQYMGQPPTHDWLVTEELTSMFGGTEALLAYIEDVRVHRREAPDSFDPEHLWTRPETGAVPSRPDRSRRTLEQALAEVGAVYDVPVDQVLATRPGRRANPAAWLGVLWVIRSTRATQRDLAKYMGVTPGRVSQIHTRAWRATREDPEFESHVHDLTDALGH